MFTAPHTMKAKERMSFYLRRWALCWLVALIAWLGLGFAHPESKALLAIAGGAAMLCLVLGMLGLVYLVLVIRESLLNTASGKT